VVGLRETTVLPRSGSNSQLVSSVFSPSCLDWDISLCDYYCCCYCCCCCLVQGIPQLISNINACQAVADAVRTTLGPRGMDKLVVHGNANVTVSNDGATIMRLLEIVHPAAKTLVDISQSQDITVGDGTTSVVLLAAEFLTQFKPLIEEGMSPMRMIPTIQAIAQLAVAQIDAWAVKNNTDEAAKYKMLLQCASTALNSKLISSHQDLFAPMVVQAISKLEPEPELLDSWQEWVSIQRIAGGDVRQSFLVEGVAFPKTFSYAGFEQMTKKFEVPKILLLNVELELKAESHQAEVRISSPSEYQSIVDAEWHVIYDKLQACVDVGANIVLSSLPIGDLATQYFADRGLFCAGRVKESDMKRVSKATHATIQTTCHGLVPDYLGTCGLFEERQVGDARFNIFEHAKEEDGLTNSSNRHNHMISTIILRGGTEQFIAESERSMEDALKVVQRCIQSNYSVVAGGGAVEMALAQYLKKFAVTIPNKEQWMVLAMSKAFEVIPRQLCDNAGLDSTDVLAALRQKHAASATAAASGDTSCPCWYGVNIEEGGITDTFELGVWEPSDNKRNSILAATEAVCVLLSIDESVIAPRSQDPGAQATGQIGGGGGGGRGGGGGNLMGNALDFATNGMGGGAQSGQVAPGVSYMKGRGGG
jgi:T-complex protein 1 subunit eta